MSNNVHRACCPQCEEQVRRDIEAEVTEQTDQAEAADGGGGGDAEDMADEHPMREESSRSDGLGSSQEYAEDDPDAMTTDTHAQLPHTRHATQGSGAAY